MIIYEAGTWGFSFGFQLAGSVFPKAVWVAIPNAVFAAVMNAYASKPVWPCMDTTGVAVIWGSYTLILGFMMVFRNNQAYIRFWEGAMLIYKMRSEWLAATACFLSFCSTDEQKRTEVLQFQQLFMRLMSLLHCTALQSIRDVEEQEDTLEVLSVDGMDPAQMAFLYRVQERYAVVMQWILRLVMNSEKAGILIVAPPILARGIHELAKGLTSLCSVKQINDVQFPFPYAQVITCMLLVHWVVTPILASQALSSWVWASLMCFFVSGAFWSLVYISMELDQPFGNDPNDLLIDQLQQEFNTELLTLLDKMSQTPPGLTSLGQNPELSMELTLSWRTNRAMSSKLGEPGKSTEMSRVADPSERSSSSTRHVTYEGQCA